MPEKVIKRDGSVSEFDRSKIETAIDKASERDVDSKLVTDKVVDKIEGKPKVEDIQDKVESVLVDLGHYKTAKSYILYRQEHREKRSEKESILDGQTDELSKKFSKNALRVLASRYLKKDSEGNIVESPSELFERVATHMVIPDILHDERVFSESEGAVKVMLDIDIEDWDVSFDGHEVNKWTRKSMYNLYKRLNEQGKMKMELPFLLEAINDGEFDEYGEQWQEYYDLMVEQEFMPNSPTLMNAGDELGQLSACFSADIEDDMNNIMDTVKESALIFKSGGGMGVNFNNIRPKGDRVASTSGVASGPISFMKMFDTMTEVVKQGGARRGALMGILEASHPDIQEFIQAKRKGDDLSNFNISVAVDSDFWEALDNDESFELVNPRNGEVTAKVDPESMLDIIAHSTWESADPGMLYLDNINKYNPLREHKGPIRHTNPCAELPLYPYQSCNLGSINLESMVEDGEFNWGKFRDTIYTATKFLDNVVDMSEFPLDKIAETTRESRKIGLGMMGLANALYRMGIKYDSEEGYQFMSELAENLTYYSMKESVELAKERGKFPLYEQSSYTDGKIPVAGANEKTHRTKDWDGLTEEIKEHGIRNSKTTTLPPTGSVAMIADTSHGVEPEFSLAYEKNVDVGDFYFSNDVFGEELKERNLYDQDLLEAIADNYGTLRGFDVPDDLKDIFVTALDIHYLDHLMAQGVLQEWITASISKTINMPADAEPSDVRRAFEVGHYLGVKGITVYRDDSKSEQVINMQGESRDNKLEPSLYVKEKLEIEN